MANCWLNFQIAAAKRQADGEPLFSKEEVDEFEVAIKKDGKDAAVQKMLDEDNYTLKQLNDAVIAAIPALAAVDNEAKAEAILDAAQVTGKERRGALKDVREGMTLGALQRVYSVKDVVGKREVSAPVVNFSFTTEPKATDLTPADLDNGSFAQFVRDFTADERQILMASYAANITAGMTERNAAILAVEAETLQVLADHKEILEAIAAVIPEGMFTKSEAMQLGLFDMPVHVETYVKKDGTVVNAHVASRKKKPVVPKRAPVGLTPDLFTDTATHHHQELPHATIQPAPETVTAVHQAPEPEAEIAAPEDLPDTLAPFGVDAGITKPARRKLNARAIEIVNSKESGFTDEEKTALAKYSGTGGVGDSLNEFYTRPDVAAAMWSLLAQLGVSSGTVLEPSCGTGVFLHTAPGAVTVVGVELDDASAKIARALHGERHEVHQSSMEGFANLDVRQFDAVIGNVPFGVRGSLVADDKPDLPTAEQYFLDTAIDKTKSDGIVALIVPTGIMDNANTRTYRESLLKKAQFVAAYRLPNTAFSHSHTSVTSDIVVFRKRAQDVAGALSALPSDILKSVGGLDDAFVSGQYFTGHTDHVFGTPEAGWRSKAGMGNDFTVVGTMDGVAQAIAASGINSIPAQAISMQDVLTAVGADDALRQRAVNGALAQPYDVASLGDTKTERGVTYVLQGQPPRWHRVGGDDAVPASVTDGVALGSMLERMFADEGNVNRKGVIEGLDEYVQKHGIPSKNKALMRAAQDDKALWRLIGAVNADGSYSNMVTGTSREEGADLDAVARRLILDHGTFTVDELAQAWHGGDAEAALDHLIASKHYAVAGDAKTWTDFDTYLTGELWPKLDGARAALQRADLDAAYRTKYEHQAAALDEAIGPKTLEDVELQLNSGWVPLAIIERWQNELKAAGNDWMRQQSDLKITFNAGVYHLFGGTGNSLLDKYLNRSGVRQDDMPRVDEMNRDFKAWVLTSDVREQIEELYNRTFLGFRKQQFSDAPIQIPGLTTERAINYYHYSNLRWALQQGKGIIADDVGLGKAQPLDAKVLTPAGWVRMGDIHVGDQVIAADGTATLVSGVFPQGEKEIYRVTFHDGSSTECCAEHLWKTQTHLDRNNQRRSGRGIAQVRTTADIATSLLYRKTKNHAIQMVAPVVFASRPVPVDAYLLGVLLGDGALSHGTPILTNSESEIIAELRLRVMGGVQVVRTKDDGRAPTYRLSKIADDRTDQGSPSENPLTGALRNLRVTVKSAEKFVPDIYKFNAVAVRLDMLRGLMDTDGYVCKLGVTVQYTSVSHQLAKDVQFLVQSLGGNATMKSKIPTFTYKGEKRQGQRAYTVHLRMPPDITPFLRSKKLARVRPKSKYQPIRYITAIESVGIKPAQCIMVEHASHLYVTDDFIVTHNTVQGLCLAKLAKAYGQAKKPMIVVPKSVLANWVAEIDLWFPGSKVLTIGETVTRDKNGKVSAKSDNETVRNTKYHELSQNADYDFVLITQPAWNDLDLNPIKKGEYVNKDFWVQRADAMGKAGDKQRNKIREQYKQAVAGRDFRKRSDAIWFDELGVDMVLYDEFHAYKNLWAARNRFGEQPKFLGGSGLSNRAHDTYLKNKHIREANGGKGVFGLTATPTKNSPLEVYSMLSHVAPEAFDAIGVGNSEAFLDRFCVFENDNIVNTQGQVESALVTAGFKNLDELRGIMARYINRRTALDVGLKIPEKQTVEHLIDMSPDQEALYVTLREQARTAGQDDNSAHIFSVMSDMGKAAIDLELVGSQYAGARSPKLEAAADAIVHGAKEGGQVVFSDFIGTHQKLRALLVARGMKADEIGIINASETESSLDRQAVSNDLNSGKVKVVIGNTATMGEGVNLQKLTTDIHNLDQPWEPASMQQRLGRGVRQGNKHAQVRVHAYLSKGSFDGYRYQTIAAKRDWQDALWHGADTIENLSRVGKIDREEMLIMLSANPDEARAAYAANKGAALEREAAKQRGEAAGVFVKFQEMKRSFAGIKNKGSETAARVKMKLDKYRLGLQANKYFSAKEALDMEVPVVVQPQTGTAWHVGRAFEMDPGPDAPINWSADAKSTWVVTGVGMGAGHERNELMVTARPYGSTATQVYSIPLSKMNKGIVPVEYSAGAETHAIEARAAQLHEAGATTAKNPAELKSMPSDMLMRLAPLIQQQLRDSFRGYKDGWRGPVGMLDATGKPVAYTSYEVRKHLDTHTFILPTLEHRAALLQAWVDMELHRTIKTHYREGRKRRGSYPSRSENGVEATYAGFEYGSEKGNPFKSIGVQLFGPEIEVEARAALRQVVMDRMDKAATFASAMNDATPLVDISTYGSTVVKWPKEVLTALWSRAQKEGITHSNLSEVLQAGVASGKTSILHRGLLLNSEYAMLQTTGEGSIARWLYKAAKAAGNAALMQDMLEVIDGHKPD